MTATPFSSIDPELESMLFDALDASGFVVFGITATGNPAVLYASIDEVDYRLAVIDTVRATEYTIRAGLPCAVIADAHFGEPVARLRIEVGS